MYYRSLVFSLAAFVAACVLQNVAHAQDIGQLLPQQGGVPTNSNGSSGNRSGSGSNEGSSGSGLGALSPEEAFSNIERGSSIGTTGETGKSFSALGSDSQSGFGGFGGAGGFGGFGGLGGMLGNQGTGGNRSQPPMIRTRLRSAIKLPHTTRRDTQFNAERSLRLAPSQAGFSGVEVRLHETTAVLSGTVSNADSRRMSELLIRLEPGVRRVENRITIQP